MPAIPAIPALLSFDCRPANVHASGTPNKADGAARVFVVPHQFLTNRQSNGNSRFSIVPGVAMTCHHGQAVGGGSETEGEVRDDPILGRRETSRNAANRMSTPSGLEVSSTARHTE
jgi:hypothetical protein